MVVVDSHCHASASWYEPIESLLFQMDRNGVDQAVLIQMFGQYDNSYQVECVARYPDRLASVVLVDTTRPTAIQALGEAAAAGAVGVRLRPTTRLPDAGPLELWRAAAHAGLAVSCAGSAAEFADPGFADIVAGLPELAVVIEHLGGVGQLDESALATAETVLALARFPNVTMKVPGLGELARRAMPVREPYPFEPPLAPWLDRALAAFGADRLMWGSDYPPVSQREGYTNALKWPREHFQRLSQADQANIFGEVARRVFFRQG